MSQTQSHFGQKLLIVAIILIAGLACLKWHQVVPVAVGFRNTDLPYEIQPDCGAYLAMASGKTDMVESPFTKRWLYPFLVKNIAAATNLSLPASFILLSLVSLIILAYCLSSSLEKLTGHPWLALPLLLTPFTLEALGWAYIPDLFHIALISIFFLLLLHDKIFWSLVILMLSFLARENTMIICVFGALIGLIKRQKLFAWGCLTVLIIGMAVGGQLAKMGKPNIHKMADPIYLAGKVPYNFLANIGGFLIWSDIRTNVGNPWKTWDIPPVLQKITADKKIGFLIDWKKPICTFITLVTIFGAGPLLFQRLWKTRNKSKRARETPMAIQLAIAYGIVSYFLGTSLGDSVERLIGYGWPAFWLALPYLICRSEWKLSRTDLICIIAGYLLICWLPSVIGHSRWTPNFFALLVLIPCYFVYRWLKKFEPVLDKNPMSAPTPPAS